MHDSPSLADVEIHPSHEIEYVYHHIINEKVCKKCQMSDLYNPSILAEECLGSQSKAFQKLNEETNKTKTSGFSEWNDVMTFAPRDGSMILLYGDQEELTDCTCNILIEELKNIVAVGYWDSIDEAWCVTGSTYRGPFFKPTMWKFIQWPVSK